MAIWGVFTYGKNVTKGLREIGYLEINAKSFLVNNRELGWSIILIFQAQRSFLGHEILVLKPGNYSANQDPLVNLGSTHNSLYFPLVLELEAE